MKYRKKPIIVEASQWLKMGDNPNVTEWEEPFFEQDGCAACGHVWYEHGKIKTLQGVHIVCPGDWVIAGIAGEMYPCKPDIFDKTYEPIHAAPSLSPRERVILEMLYRARGLIEEWAAYADEYFQEKHNLAGDLSELDEFLSSMESV